MELCHETKNKIEEKKSCFTWGWCCGVAWGIIIFEISIPYWNVASNLRCCASDPAHCMVMCPGSQCRWPKSLGDLDGAPGHMGSSWWMQDICMCYSPFEINKIKLRKRIYNFPPRILCEFYIYITSQMQPVTFQLPAAIAGDCTGQYSLKEASGISRTAWGDSFKRTPTFFHIKISSGKF